MARYKFYIVLLYCIKKPRFSTAMLVTASVRARTQCPVGSVDRRRRLMSSVNYAGARPFHGRNFVRCLSHCSYCFPRQGARKAPRTLTEVTHSADNNAAGLLRMLTHSVPSLVVMLQCHIFRLRFGIDTISTKYHDNDFDIS